MILTDAYIYYTVIVGYKTSTDGLMSRENGFYPAACTMCTQSCLHAINANALQTMGQLLAQSNLHSL